MFATYQSTSQRVSRPPRPITLGWLVEALLCAEEKTGRAILGALTVASPLRRASVFLLCALRRHPVFADEIGDDYHSAVEELLYARCQEVLRQAGLNITGLLGALQRTQGEPLDRREDYADLIKLLSESSDRQRASLLRHVPLLTSTSLYAVKTLDPSFLTPTILASFRSINDAVLTKEVLSFIQSRSSRPLDPTLIKIGCKQSLRDGRRWASRLLLQYGDQFPEGPIDDDGFFRLLNGPDMAKVSLQLRNCLKTRVVDAAAGSVAFYFANTDPVSVIEMRRISVGNRPHLWILKSINIARNAPVPFHVTEEIEHRLAQLGLGRIREAIAVDVKHSLAEELRAIDPWYGL